MQEEKREILSFLIELKRQGVDRRLRRPGQGQHVAEFLWRRTDFIDYTVDLNPHKQGHLLPGSHIPDPCPRASEQTKPDVVLILPWNLRDEIIEQHAYVRDWGGRFAARAPEMRLLD